MDQQHSSFFGCLALCLLGGFVYHETSKQPQSDLSQESALFVKTNFLYGRPDEQYLEEKIEIGPDMTSQKLMELSKPNPIQEPILMLDDETQLTMSPDAKKVIIDFARDMDQIDSEVLGNVASQSKRIARHATLAAVTEVTAQQARKDPDSEMVSAAQVLIAMDIVSTNLKKVVDMDNVESACDEINGFYDYMDSEALDAKLKESYHMEGVKLNAYDNSINNQVRRILSVRPHQFQTKLGKSEKPYQKTIETLLSDLPFKKLVGHAAQSYALEHVEFNELAVIEVQAATVEYFDGLHKDSDLCASYAKRAYSMSKNTQPTRRKLASIDWENEPARFTRKLVKRTLIWPRDIDTTSDLIRGDTSGVLRGFLGRVVCDAAMYAKREGRNTVTAEDVICALDREGR